ncbi:hypothetical protein E4631_16210 [Hymenobacter sp. UV11]|uniref:hypothetical protein n=1 Tax=Hymenobacter sp. UV11 TaxID=1849735 RepID=UPI001060AEC2|nr:hypothetical protein [Hymenobacter sp. UV11]TDN37876.1 hypothetical protein A8B98_01045 [Hymenobacter sp. UV11]TFZ65087.1 hypothetical protein E4631_16210 [Hymenobacter sp. UV11]
MKNLLRFLPLSPLLVLAAGCCANNACDCRDTLADSIYLTLNDDPAKGKAFTKAELDTVYLLRYNPLTAGRNYDSIPLTDTLRILQQQRTPLLAEKLALAGLSAPKAIKTNTIVLSNTSPFAPGTTGGKLSSYYYSLVVKDKSVKQTIAYTFAINQINLKGQYNADGCCTCYQNILKQVNVNGKTWGLTENGGNPIPVVLYKP